MSDDSFAGGGGGSNVERARGVPSCDVDASSWLDAVFDVFADKRRRYMLYYLVQEPNEAVERSALVTVIHDFEEEDAGTTSEAPTEASIKWDLNHTQLPKLAAAGLIEYDTRHGTVRYTGSPEVAAWVEKARKQEEVKVCSTDS